MEETQRPVSEADLPREVKKEVTEGVGSVDRNECTCLAEEECLQCHHSLKCPNCGEVRSESGWHTYTSLRCLKCRKEFLNPKNTSPLQVPKVDSSLPKWQQLDWERRNNEGFFRDEDQFLKSLLRRPGGRDVYCEAIRGLFTQKIERGLAFHLDHSKNHKTYHIRMFDTHRHKLGCYPDCEISKPREKFVLHFFIKIQGVFGPREVMVLNQTVTCDICGFLLDRFIVCGLNFPVINKFRGVVNPKLLEKYYSLERVKKVVDIQDQGKEVTEEMKRVYSLLYLSYGVDYNYTKKFLEELLTELLWQEEKQVMSEWMGETLPLPKAVSERVLVEFL